jgi:hypothetical protein
MTEEEERRARDGREQNGWMWSMCTQAMQLQKSKSQNAQTSCISSTRAGGANATLCADHIISIHTSAAIGLGPYPVLVWLDCMRPGPYTLHP